MTSAGNDIVAFKKTNFERIKEKIFYSKILCKTELDLFQKELSEKISFENFVWLSWSIKEAGYKFFKRLDPDLDFSPLKFIVPSVQFPEQHFNLRFTNNYFENTDINEDCFYTASVLFEENILYSKSIIHKDFISTIVNDAEDFSKICWGIKSIDHSDYANQSKEIRSFLLEKMNSIFPDENIQIEKHEVGYPVLLKDEKIMDIPVSFSHHSNFIGYCFELID
jgi:phosphopantetheinyl transferase (holo-ACP synthase)